MKKSFKQKAIKTITTVASASFLFAGMLGLGSISAKAAVTKNYTIDLSNGRVINLDSDRDIDDSSRKDALDAEITAMIMDCYDPEVRKNFDYHLPANGVTAVMSKNPLQGAHYTITEKSRGIKVSLSANEGSEGIGRYVLSKTVLTQALEAYDEIDAAEELYFINELLEGRGYSYFRSKHPDSDFDLVLNVEIKYSDAPVITNNTINGTPSVSFVPGREIEDNGIKYRILDAAGNLSAVELTSKAKNVVIPDSVSYVGHNLNVTDIAQNFMKGDKKAKKVTIGSNVTSIGKNAFYKSKKLKKVIVKTTKLTSIGKKAFGKNAKGFTLKMPKSCKKAYKKLLKKAKIKL